MMQSRFARAFGAFALAAALLAGAIQV